MKSYETINWKEKSEDEVMNYLFDKLEDAEQCDFLMWLMKHFPDLEIEWLERFESLTKDLLKNGKIDSVISFVEWYKQKNMDDYRQRFEFIERDGSDYF